MDATERKVGEQSERSDVSAEQQSDAEQAGETASVRRADHSHRPVDVDVLQQLHQRIQVAVASPGFGSRRGTKRHRNHTDFDFFFLGQRTVSYTHLTLPTKRIV